MSMTALLIVAPLAVLAFCALFSRAIGDGGFGAVSEADSDGCGGDGGD
jgi:hypothetical protein